MSMAPKRKNIATNEELTGREKKKQKLAVARTIAVQPGEGAMPSSSTFDSSNSASKLSFLPSSIDVEKFAEARAFEISAMHAAMANASGSSTSRAWQALPRHLRRRAASHDVRRVPLRLREKARAEMDPVSKKRRPSGKPGQDKRVNRTELFAKRQRDKLWLETHIWHAKRMKMENLWGYRLAVRPTEKAYRPSHRASVHGSIIHDASYFSLIEVKGPEGILKKILDMCCDPHGASPGSKRYNMGARALETYIYRPGTYPFGLLSPVTIIWKPLSSASLLTKERRGLDPNERPTINQQASKRREKRKIGVQEGGRLHVPGSDGTRVVWLRSHPSAFEGVLSSIRHSASLVLEAAEREAKGRTFEVEIADLRGQVNVFEIMGPKSNQVLRGALNPVPQDERSIFKTFWSRLANVQTSGELSRGTIIGFKVVDPRLRFPPKNSRAQLPHTDHRATDILLPSAELAQSEIWDETIRSSLVRPRYKKKDLDERRSKLLVPGTPLKPERQDDRVPVLLVQRSLEDSDSRASGIHGWTLIIPAGWAMAFFESLIFTGTRVGGQRERQTQAFEAAIGYFPRDLPSSVAYETYSSTREHEERAKWERKPPAKRPNFDKLGTRSPWRADWESVLGLPPKKPIQEDQNKSEDVLQHMVTTQRESEASANRTGATQEEPNIWLLRGSEASLVVSNTSRLFNHGAGLMLEINRLRAKRELESLDASIKAEALLKGALVLVKLRMCKRGAPEDIAMIYSVDDIEARRWDRAFRSFNGVDVESPEEIALGNIVPENSSIIGYITTGHFSLSYGQGFGIGAVSLVKFLELQDQSERLRANTSSPNRPLLVKIRNRSSQQCHAAHIEVLSS